MYSTCLFCHAALGANEVIERFPVGRRLAFDAAKGRLWVVCRRCMRWNLTPLDERWEAIEECERQFSETRLRVSTDNIGMARVREGLELVRIGKALRPEIAVWRYASVNETRRRRAKILGGLGLAAGFGGVFFAGPAIGLSAGWLSWKLASVASERLTDLLKGKYRRIALPTEEGIVRIPHASAGKAELVSHPETGWAIRVPSTHGPEIEYSGPQALLRLSTLLTAVNLDGVRKEAVEAGERILTDAGDVDALLRRLSDVPRGFALPPSARRGRAQTNVASARPFTLGRLAEGNRVALEMAASEESERRAMEGELALLEEAWKEAEEIAAIADDMFLPAGVQEFIDRARGR
ncbi:MAG TPA: hypothetical protein VF761_19970 [Gemmatimonadaceae bacterium]